MAVELVKGLFFSQNIQSTSATRKTEEKPNVGNILAGNTKETTSSVGKYEDDDKMTGMAKATQELFGVIRPDEAEMLGIEKDFERVSKIAWTDPVDESAFQNAIAELKSIVANKRQEYGVSGGLDTSLCGRADFELKKLEKGKIDEDAAIQSLNALKSKAVGRDAGTKMFVNQMTTYINGLKTLKNGDAIIKTGDGKVIDKADELKKAVTSKDSAKINDILAQTNKENQPINTPNNQNNHQQGFSDLFKSLM